MEVFLFYKIEPTLKMFTVEEEKLKNVFKSKK